MKHIKKYNENFEPESDFLKWLKDNYLENIWENIKGIDCDGNHFYDLNGIDILSNLEKLDCSNNSLVNLNLQSSINLKFLYCSNNTLIDLNIENLENLEELWCYNNYLEKIEGIEHLKNLKVLWCNGNKFDNEYKLFLLNWCNDNNIKFEI